jgi:hypothetical protein
MKNALPMIFLLFCTTSLCADKKEQQTKGTELLEQARVANDIYSIPHFYLEAAVSFGNGKDIVPGHYKLYWDGKGKWRDEFEVGSYKEVRIGLGEKVWNQRSSPEMSLYEFEFRRLMNISSQLQMDPSYRIAGLSEKKIQGAQAHCVKLEAVGKFMIGNHALCVDVSTSAILENGSRQYSDARHIGEKIFPFTWYSGKNFPITWYSGKKLSISVNVMTLTESISFDPMLFQPPAQTTPVIGCHLPIEPRITLPAPPNLSR